MIITIGSIGSRHTMHSRQTMHRVIAEERICHLSSVKLLQQQAAGKPQRGFGRCSYQQQLLMVRSCARS